MRMENAAHDPAGRSSLREFFIGKGAASGCPFHRFNHRVVEDVKAVWGIGRQAFGRRESLPEPFQKADGAKAEPFAIRVQELGASEALLRLPSEEPSGAGFSVALLKAKMDDLNRQFLLPDAPACDARPAEQPNPSQRDAEPADARNGQIPLFQPPASSSGREGLIPLQLPDFIIQSNHPPPPIGAPYGPQILVPEPRASPGKAGRLDGCAYAGLLPEPWLGRLNGHPILVRGASAAIHQPEKPETASAPSAAQRGPERRGPNPGQRQSRPPATAITAAPVMKMAAAKNIQDAARKEPRSRIAERGKKPKKTPLPKTPDADRKPKKAPAAPLTKYPGQARTRHPHKPEAGVLRKPPSSAKESGLPREKGKTPKTRHPEDAWLEGIKAKKKKNIRTPSRAPSGARAPP